MDFPEMPTKYSQQTYISLVMALAVGRVEMGMVMVMVKVTMMVTMMASAVRMEI